MTNHGLNGHSRYEGVGGRLKIVEGLTVESLNR